MREALGLELVDDRYYLFIAGDYLPMGGIPVKIEGFEDFDLFLGMVGSRYVVGEGITGTPLTMGPVPQEVLERTKAFLLNLGRLYMEKRIAERIFEEGRLSPRYRMLLSSGPCKKCRAFKSLYGKDLCYRCFFIEPAEKLSALIGG